MDLPRLAAADETASSQVVPISATEAPEGEPCWVCGHPTIETHCKIICPNCGFTRDCSDP